MGAASNYLEIELLDHLLNSLSWTSPASIYVALSTADPTEDGSGIAEPADTYARQAVTGSPRFTQGAGGGDEREAANTNNIEFPEATASWGSITHFALFDAASGGNMLIHGALTNPVSVGAGETVRFKAGDLAVTLD